MLDPYLTSHAPCKCNTIPMCPQISIHLPHAVVLYDLGFSFFSFHSADRPTPETLTTLNRTPGISPFALPLRPNPASRTSSFSSTKLRQPSLGTISHQPLSSSIPISFSAPKIPNVSPLSEKPRQIPLVVREAERLPNHPEGSVNSVLSRPRRLFWVRQTL